VLDLVDDSASFDALLESLKEPIAEVTRPVATANEEYNFEKTLASLDSYSRKLERVKREGQAVKAPSILDQVEQVLKDFQVSGTHQHAQRDRQAAAYY